MIMQTFLQASLFSSVYANVMHTLSFHWIFMINIEKFGTHVYQIIIENVLANNNSKIFFLLLNSRDLVSVWIYFYFIFFQKRRFCCCYTFKNKKYHFVRICFCVFCWYISNSFQFSLQVSLTSFIKCLFYILPFANLSDLLMKAWCSV